jgi:asparagine synthase (glutamine-hydrolysing)
MCGIFGYWDRKQEPLHDEVLRGMAQALFHRGPDDEGYALFDTAASTAHAFSGADTDRRLSLPPLASAGAFRCDLAFAHRRLSILDLSAAGHQPMTSADGRYWMVFNGEIYNFVELRQELEALGRRFRTGTDTEVLLAAFAEWDVAALPRLVGMFAFAVVDMATRRLLLARDAFGIKPLYYVHDARGLAFASEIPALLELADVAPVVEPSALYAYLRFGFTDAADGTMLSGMRQLPAAHWLEYSLAQRGVPRLGRYWGLDLRRRIDLPFDEAVTEFRRLFQDSVRLHLRSDVPLGCCLSGGLDSSAIVMTMREVIGPGADLATFSFVADEPAISEGPYVDLVSRAACTRGFTVTPSADDLVRDLERLIATQGEPFGSTSIYAQFRVFQLAREAGVTVMLDGQGSDEILGGYVTAVSAQLAGWLVEGRWADALSLLRRTPMLASGARRRVALSGLGRLLPPTLAVLAMQAVGEELFPPWLNRDWFEGRAVRPRPRRQGRGRDSLREELAACIESLTLPQLLRYEDRNSMAFSIESRVPFCVPSLAEFALSLPPDYLVRADGTQKAVLRRAMQGIVPQSVLDRPKVGFATPEQRWLRHLAPWLGATVRSDHALALPFLNRGGVERLMTAQLESSRYLSPSLWRVVNLVHWMRQYDVQVAA